MSASQKALEIGLKCPIKIRKYFSQRLEEMCVQTKLGQFVNLTSKKIPKRPKLDQGGQIFFIFKLLEFLISKKGAAVPSSFSHAEIFDFARPMIEHSHHFKGINQKFLRLPGILKFMFLVFKKKNKKSWY